MRHTKGNLASSLGLTRRVSAAAMLTLCGTALGQTNPGDGHALDANLHAIQGRINPRANGIEQQIRFNNAVIHGTAPNGLSFQGSVPYFAPNQFATSLPTDALYNFRRDSFNSGLGAAGVRGSDALRYQFSMTTGQQVPGFMAAAPYSVPRDATVATGASTTAMRSTSNFITAQSYRPTLVGTKQDELGAEYVAKASPLLGVTWVKTAESPLGTTTPDLAPGVPPNGLTPTPGALPDTSTTPGTMPASIPGIPGAQAKPTKAVEKVMINPFTGLETAAHGVDSVLDRANAAIDTRVPSANQQADTQLHNQLVTRFRQGFDEATVKSALGVKGAEAPQATTFQMQMDRLHRLLNGQPEEPPTPERAPDGTLNVPKPTPAQPGEAPKAEEGIRGGVGRVNAGESDRAAREAEKRANPVLDALTPDFMRAMKKVQEKKVEHFIEPAPKIGPDTSADPEGYRRMMREGEQLLAQGRYFDAEERFVRAIAGAPNDPMARAGRIHAQIGAGLYLSAAANLRALLAGHPEMAPVRYAENLLPGGERAKAVAEQLLEQERKAESSLGRESALLVAYMGYQRGDDKLVTDGLNDFGQRIAPDEQGSTDLALLELLRAAWTK